MVATCRLLHVAYYNHKSICNLMPRQEWKIQKKIRKIYMLSCSILLTTCCYFLSLFYPLQNLQHMNNLQSLLFKHCSNIEFTFLILNPKFHSFKSTGFESIIEFFCESCCNYLKCVSGFLYIVHITHSSFTTSDAASTMSSRSGPFMSWPIHTSATYSMWRPPM